MELQRAIGDEHIHWCAGRSCLLTHRSAHASAPGAMPPRARPAASRAAALGDIGAVVNHSRTDRRPSRSSACCRTMSSTAGPGPLARNCESRSWPGSRRPITDAGGRTHSTDWHRRIRVDHDRNRHPGGL